MPENWDRPKEGLDEHDSEEEEKLAELSNPTKRVLGPALPPQVLLDQAAEVAEAVRVPHTHTQNISRSPQFNYPSV